MHQIFKPKQGRTLSRTQSITACTRLLLRGLGSRLTSQISAVLRFYISGYMMINPRDPGEKAALKWTRMMIGLEDEHV